MREKALNLLGLMRKAGKIELGEMNVGAAVKERRAKLILLTPDAGANARDRAERFARSHEIPFVELPFMKEELSKGVGKANTVMAAVTDSGFAKAFITDLGEGMATCLKSAGAMPETGKQELRGATHKYDDKIQSPRGRKGL